MDTYIRCSACAFCVSKYYEFFDNAKIALYNKEVFGSGSKVAGYDVDKLFLVSDGIPPLEIIFDALNIKNECCRKTLLTRMDYDKHYKF